MVRYALSGWVIQRFPAGTFAVNLLGSMLIGLIMSLAVRSGWPGPMGRAFLVTGIMGGLTTFSTFSYQTWELAESGQLNLAVLNVVSNLGLGLLAVMAGVTVGEFLARTPPG